MEKIQDLEAKAAKAITNFKEELGKIDVDVEEYAFTVAKIKDGISVSMLVKVNVTKK